MGNLIIFYGNKFLKSDEMENNLNQEEIDDLLTNDYLKKYHKQLDRPFNTLVKKLETIELLKNYLDWNYSSAYLVNKQSILFTISIKQRILEDEGYDSAIDN